MFGPGCLVAPLVFWAPSGPAARVVCLARPGCLVCPWAAARPRAVRAASFARRVVSKPGQAPPPPTGTAAWPSGALHTGGACVAVCGGASPRSSVMPRPPRDRHTRAFGSEWSISKPARALRTLRHPPCRRCCRDLQLIASLAGIALDRWVSHYVGWHCTAQLLVHRMRN